MEAINPLVALREMIDPNVVGGRTEYAPAGDNGENGVLDVFLGENHVVVMWRADHPSAFRITDVSKDRDAGYGSGPDVRREGIESALKYVLGALNRTSGQSDSTAGAS
jgi:hypothetical protein